MYNKTNSFLRSFQFVERKYREEIAQGRCIYPYFFIGVLVWNGGSSVGVQVPKVYPPQAINRRPFAYTKP